LVTIIAAIIVFGVLISVHELGHFIAAKMVGMRVDEFAIGFGPKIYQSTDKETTYTLRAFPLGGFNRIAGMEPGEENVENGFHTKPLWARMVVILAGVFMNFLLPLILFTGVYAVEGIESIVDKPTLGKIIEKEPAAQAGLLSGDEIISINGEKLERWGDLSAALQKQGNKKSIFVIRRGEKVLEKTVLPQYNKERKRYLIGVMPQIEHHSISFKQSVVYAIDSEVRITRGMLRGLKMILTRQAAVEVAGPIGVAQMAGSVAQEGMGPFFMFIAFLSINLAILNLIPIPALDGGQFLILVVEGLIHRPLPEKAKRQIQFLGVALILALTIYATISDILR
jgi:regulator of sigma E protease